MLKIPAATARIQRELLEAENAANAALLANAKLMVSMVTARLDNDVPATTGQAALLRLQKAQQSLIESVSDMGRVHKELLGVASQVDAALDENGCPEREKAQANPLREVA